MCCTWLDNLTICTYQLNGELCTAAYLRQDAIYLAPISETNKVHWDGATRFIPKTSGNAGLNGYFYESVDLKNNLLADAVFTLDENYAVTKIAFSVTDAEYPGGRSASISVADMYDSAGILKANADRYAYISGSLSGIDGFSPSSPEEDKKPAAVNPEKEEQKEEEKDEEQNEATEESAGILKTTYTDLSKGPKQKYATTFSIPLTAEQEATWIGEFAENGKVCLTVTHFYYDADGSMVTVSGNGKSFHLMYTGVIHRDSKQQRVWYSTTEIGVEKDTSLPHETLQHGAISLNWKTGAQYLVGEELNVAIYNKAFVSEDGSYRDSNGNKYEAATLPVGGFIPLTEKGELIDLMEDKETPVSAAPEEVQFDDVPESHWAHSAVHSFYRAGIVRGVGNNLFAPDSHMTYEHFALLLSRLFGYEAENKESIPATRQTVFTELVKAVGMEKETVANEHILTERFTDADNVSAENVPFVKIAVEQGLVQGANGLLHPDGTLTRAECVTLLFRGLTAAFGITEEDAPESYKFKLTRSENGYTKLNSNALTYFRLNGEVLVKSSERLCGRVMMVFGEDALRATKLIATCTVDQDIYSIETTTYEQLSFGNDVFLRGYVNLYKNGQLHHANAYMEIIYRRDEDTLTLRRGTNTRITFENVIKQTGKFPKTPAIQPYLEAEKESAQYDTTVFADIGLGLGKGRDLDIGFDSDIAGGFTVRYSTAAAKADVSASFSATDIHGLPNQYEIRLIKAASVSESEIAGSFQIMRNGEALEITDGRLTGLNAGIGNNMYFLSDNAVWSIELTIVEISK